MMRLNPIIKSEIEIKSRSLTLPMLILIMNSILFIVGLAGSSSIILSMHKNYTVNFGAFLKVYFAVALLAYLMILFIAPLLTAGSISGEIERRTFDLLLTTRLSSTDIVAEKLASAYLSMLMLSISMLPAIMVPLMFGGVEIQSCIFLMLVIILEAGLVLNIGMFASCVGRSVVRSIAIAYACTLGIIVGPALIAALLGTFSAPGRNSAVYILAIDPLLPVLKIVLDQIGEGRRLQEVFMLINAVLDQGFLHHAVLISMAIQMAMSFGFFMLAVISIMPHGISRLKKKTVMVK